MTCLRRLVNLFRRTRTTYSQSFKVTVVNMVLADGRSPQQAEADLDLVQGTVSRWIRRYGPTAVRVAEERRRLIERELGVIQKGGYLL